MATEKVRNLAETTLASGYTAASGSIEVDDASDFPTTGVFRVALGNDDRTVFRVDSVSGTTFTGAAEDNDANADSGASVIGVGTRGAFERLIQSPEAGEARSPSGVDGGTFYGPIHKLTALDQAAWSWVNQGGFSVTQAGGIVYLAGPASGAGNNVKLRVTTAPSTPYTITAAVIPLTGTGFSFVGIGLRHASSGRFIHMLAQQDRAVNVNRQNSATSFSATAANRATAHGGGHLLFLRMRDDGTNVVYSYSADGVNFTQLHSEARTAFINTPDQVAITAGHEGTGIGDAGGSILSWVQS